MISSMGMWFKIAAPSSVPSTSLNNPQGEGGQGVPLASCCCFQPCCSTFSKLHRDTMGAAGEMLQGPSLLCPGRGEDLAAWQEALGQEESTAKGHKARLQQQGASQGLKDTEMQPEGEFQNGQGRQEIKLL